MDFPVEIWYTNSCILLECTALHYNHSLLTKVWVVILKEGNSAMDSKMIVDSINILCKINNISISQLEKDLNFKPSLIDSWNNSLPTLDEIVDIANYFEVSLDDLIKNKIKK